MEAIRIVSNAFGRQMLCPECDQHLPIDQKGECSRCGAHLEVKVEVVAPAINDN